MQLPVQTITFRNQPCVELHLPSGDRVLVALHGGQVLAWQTSDAVERLYLSPNAVFDGQNAIRGGVPICFPQFNQRKLGEQLLPKHGFARSLAWSVLDPTRLQDIDLTHSASSTRPSVSVALGLTQASLPREIQMLWPYKFEAILLVHLEKNQLRITLSVSNRDHEEWSFAVALHTYLRVSELAQSYVKGLQGVRYWDAVKDLKAPETVQRQRSEDLHFASESERVYQAAPALIHLLTPTGVLDIEQSATFTETVVWNPGAALCAQLTDMPKDGYREMLCVEAACIDHAINLKPGANWQGSQILSVGQR